MSKKGPKRFAGLGDRLCLFAEHHGIPLTPDQRDRLAQLDGLVTRWSHALDLSGFRDAEHRVHRYFLEVLDASRWLPGQPGAALDVGAGGGSPALPLALVRPGYEWTLLEPNRRRAVFLEEALTELDLQGAKVERVRLQDFSPPTRFVVITSRGVSLDQGLVERMSRWLEPGGRLLLFTGRTRSAALLGWRGSLTVRARVALVPDLRAWLVVLERPSGPTAAPPNSPDAHGPAGGTGT